MTGAWIELVVVCLVAWFVAAFQLGMRYAVHIGQVHELENTAKVVRLEDWLRRRRFQRALVGCDLEPELEAIARYLEADVAPGPMPS